MSGDINTVGPRGAMWSFGVGGGELGLHISSSDFAVKGVGVAPAHNLWGKSLETGTWDLDVFPDWPVLCTECGDCKGKKIIIVWCLFYNEVNSEPNFSARLRRN